MWADFQALCDLGGRLAGSASEAAALAFARQRLAGVPAATVRDDPVDYPGWRCRTAQLTSAMADVSFPCTPLLGTASAAGLVAEVLDLGLGRREDFEQHASGIRGRIVMVRHEYPFASGHVHRRVKLGLAQQMGAVGFLIAHPEPGVGPVSGSSGRNGGAGIPALGIGIETADAFRRSPDGTLPTQPALPDVSRRAGSASLPAKALNNTEEIDGSFFASNLGTVAGRLTTVTSTSPLNISRPGSIPPSSPRRSTAGCLRERRASGSISMARGASTQTITRISGSCRPIYRLRSVAG